MESVTFNEHPASVQGAARLLLEEVQEMGLSHLLQAPLMEAEVPARPKSPDLSSIQQRIEACRACPLASTRTQVVPGAGPVATQVMFVGEAPGAEEDRTGLPFVGKAGQLLTKIIEDGMGLLRQEVFITNILKCRPPENRDPSLQEKSACTGFLTEQIETIQPKLLVALGRHAACALLDSEASLGQLRGKIHPNPHGGPPILATYHPAYLLRSPSAKKDCWADIQLGMAHLGIPKKS